MWWQPDELLQSNACAACCLQLSTIDCNTCLCSNAKPKSIQNKDAMHDAMIQSTQLEETCTADKPGNASEHLLPQATLEQEFCFTAWPFMITK
jgi:hypothetical protein